MTIVRWGIFLSLFSFLFTSVASADRLPNRQRRLAIYHVSLTAPGQQLLQQFEEDDDIYDAFIWGEPGDNRLYKVSREDLTVTMNHNLMGGAPQYISWVFAMALAERQTVAVTKNAGLALSVDFADVAVYAFHKGMQHWVGLGAPNQYDSVLSSNRAHRRFAKDIEGSVGEFHEFYEDDSEEFEAKVVERHRSLGFDRRTVEDYLEGRLNRRQRRAAEALQNFLSGRR